MLAIERCARGADDGVDHRIEKARGVLLPRFLVGIDQAEVLEAKVSAVGDFVTIVVVQAGRSEAHTTELQSLMRISYAVFCLKKKKIMCTTIHTNKHKCSHTNLS